MPVLLVAQILSFFPVQPLYHIHQIHQSYQIHQNCQNHQIHPNHQTHQITHADNSNSCSLEKHMSDNALQWKWSSMSARTSDSKEERLALTYFSSKIRIV